MYIPFLEFSNFSKFSFFECILYFDFYFNFVYFIYIIYTRTVVLSYCRTVELLNIGIIKFNCVDPLNSSLDLCVCIDQLEGAPSCGGASIARHPSALLAVRRVILSGSIEWD